MSKSIWSRVLGVLGLVLLLSTMVTFLFGNAQYVLGKALLGLAGIALVDEGSLSGAVRFVRAAERTGIPALLGVEFEMADPAVPDRDGVVLPLPRGGAAGAFRRGCADVRPRERCRVGRTGGAVTGVHARRIPRPAGGCARGARCGPVGQ